MFQGSTILRVIMILHDKNILDAVVRRYFYLYNTTDTCIWCNRKCITALFPFSPLEFCSQKAYHTLSMLSVFSYKNQQRLTGFIVLFVHFPLASVKICVYTLTAAGRYNYHKVTLFHDFESDMTWVYHIIKYRIPNSQNWWYMYKVQHRVSCVQNPHIREAWVKKSVSS